MDTTWLVLLIVAGILLLAGFVVGLVFLILFLVKSLGGTTRGWRRLAKVYATDNPPTGQITKRETIQVGAVTYKRCATLGVADEGLYVSIWRKTALIPWTEFKAVGQATLFWQKVPMLTVGDPPVATVTVPVAVFQVMRGRFRPTRSSRWTACWSPSPGSCGPVSCWWPVGVPSVSPARSAVRSLR